MGTQPARLELDGLKALGDLVAGRIADGEVGHFDKLMDKVDSHGGTRTAGDVGHVSAAAVVGQTRALGSDGRASGRNSQKRGSR